MSSIMIILALRVIKYNHIVLSSSREANVDAANYKETKAQIQLDAPLGVSLQACIWSSLFTYSLKQMHIDC